MFGRWDDTKAEENIDFMPTILSRFDTIFIIKVKMCFLCKKSLWVIILFSQDEHNEARDITLAKHVMNIHVNAAATEDQNDKGELSLNFLKKFINYARSRCGPRLSQVNQTEFVFLLF